jgi:hypothetical protein
MRTYTDDSVDNVVTQVVFNIFLTTYDSRSASSAPPPLSATPSVRQVCAAKARLHRDAAVETTDIDPHLVAETRHDAELVRLQVAVADFVLQARATSPRKAGLQRRMNHIHSRPGAGAWGA